jgi:hypothetical protein
MQQDLLKNSGKNCYIVNGCQPNANYVNDLA